MSENIYELDNYENTNISDKEWSVTLLLCIFMGLVGFHRFYVGKAGTAILMLLTLGGFGIWTLVDLIKIIVNSFEDENNKVIQRKREIN